jgi:hypothetical protein
MNGESTDNPPGRSPVIPFYWGYKPVTHEDYRADLKGLVGFLIFIFLPGIYFTFHLIHECLFCVYLRVE